MNSYDFDNTINANIEDIWEVLQDPATVIAEGNEKIEKESNTKWKQIVNENIFNEMSAEFIEYTVHISSVNSQYKGEKNDIIISLEAIDEQSTNVKVHYDIKTTAIFNKISLHLFGEKLMHHADNVIVKNIKKKLK